MKDITKKQKISMIIIALIILVGTIIALTIGFNFDLKYQKTKRISIYLDKQFEISDIKKIAKETLDGQKVAVQKVEVYEDTVSIMAKDISEEQKQKFIEKINEKYEKEFNTEQIEIETVANTRGRDMLKQYIVPFVITTAIILVYMAIRYRKLGWVDVTLKSVGSIILTQIVLFSMIAIVRIPLGNITPILVIATYVAVLICLTEKYEKDLKEKVAK
ncbi:MAG: hypothetical protein HUJ68_00475 [Clostridia bacterium]|nr:hypothetical protein [Clostridia bacterium]